MDDNQNNDDSMFGQDSSDSSDGGKSRRGFASMPQDKQREIASKGGRAAHAQGTAHEWDSEEAREAGRKGGQSRGANANAGEETEETL